MAKKDRTYGSGSSAVSVRRGQYARLAPLSGWRYVPGHAGDTSVTGWQIQVLHAAEVSGLKVPKETWDRTGKFLDSVGSKDGSGYTPLALAADSKNDLLVVILLEKGAQVV